MGQAFQPAIGNHNSPAGNLIEFRRRGQDLNNLICVEWWNGRLESLPHFFRRCIQEENAILASSLVQYITESKARPEWGYAFAVFRHVDFLWNKLRCQPQTSNLRNKVQRFIVRDGLVTVC